MVINNKSAIKGCTEMLPKRRTFAHPNDYLQVKKRTMKYSFLIGSGFSVPKNLPTVSKINEIFTSLNADEIFVGLDRTVFFLGDNEDPNGWMTQQPKDFFVQFIADYCIQIGGTDKFNYEGFYDYYYSYLRGEENKNIDNFCDSFRKSKKPTVERDNINLVSDFNNLFVQLLSSTLQRKEFHENSIHQVNYPPYDALISYLHWLTEQEIKIDIHTLNHDLLFEHIGFNTNLKGKFCDGFLESGSRYYGHFKIEQPIRKKFMVRLKYFQNYYPLPIRLYKLHGSIDMYSFNLASPNPDRTRIKSDYGTWDYYKEQYNGHIANFEYIRVHTEQFPDFLSGTTEKLRNYGDRYYKILFDHFYKNLEEAEKLIIIGYGFWDSGINEILLDKFISKGNIPIVIDPYKSHSPFYKKHTFNHISKSIANVTLDEYKNL